jgi:hypothetical protein
MLKDAISGGGGGGPPAGPGQTAAAAGGGGQAGSGGGGGSGAGEPKLAAWTRQLSKETRENPELAKKLSAWETLDGFAKSYFELEAEGALPGKGAKPEEADAFWRGLGYPEKPENYGVSKEKGSGAFISAAHAARLTDEQATALWQKVSEGAKGQTEALRKKQMEEIEAADKELQKEYGEKYDYAIEMLRRGIGKSPVYGLLQEAGLAGDPDIIRAFIALGESGKEDYAPVNSSTGAASPLDKDFMNSAWEFPKGRREEEGVTSGKKRGG